MAENSDLTIAAIAKIKVFNLWLDTFDEAATEIQAAISAGRAPALKDLSRANRAAAKLLQMTIDQIVNEETRQ